MNIQTTYRYIIYYICNQIMPNICAILHSHVPSPGLTSLIRYLVSTGHQAQYSRYKEEGCLDLDPHKSDKSEIIWCIPNTLRSNILHLTHPIKAHPDLGGRSRFLPLSG
jgi:hypothetical protein